MGRLSNFRNPFGRKVDLFSDKHKDYIEIPKLRREKNSPKLLKDLKSDFNQLTKTADIRKEQFATLNELLGFVVNR